LTTDNVSRWHAWRKCLATSPLSIKPPAPKPNNLSGLPCPPERQFLELDVHQRNVSSSCRAAWYAYITAKKCKRPTGDGGRVHGDSVPHPLSFIPQARRPALLRRRSCVKLGRPAGFQLATAFESIVNSYLTVSGLSPFQCRSPDFCTGCRYAKVIGPESGPGIHQTPQLYSIPSAPHCLVLEEKSSVHVPA